MTQLPIPVHVGTEAPIYWDGLEARQREYGEDAAPWLQQQRRPAAATPDLDWGGAGFDPRWVGADTAACAAALQPNIFSGQGADEFTRFRRGVESRGEIAVVVSPIGGNDEESSDLHNVFGTPHASVSIGHTYTSIDGRLLGTGATVHAADDLGDADAEPVIATLDLFDAWRHEDPDTIRRLLFGTEVEAAAAETPPTLPVEGPAVRPVRRRWFGRH